MILIPKSESCKLYSGKDRDARYENMAYLTRRVEFSATNLSKYATDTIAALFYTPDFGVKDKRGSRGNMFLIVMIDIFLRSGVPEDLITIKYEPIEGYRTRTDIRIWGDQMDVELHIYLSTSLRERGVNGHDRNAHILRCESSQSTKGAIIQPFFYKEHEKTKDHEESSVEDDIERSVEASAALYMLKGTRILTVRDELGFNARMMELMIKVRPLSSSWDR